MKVSPKRNESITQKRLSRLNMEEDIIYCLTKDQTNIVPVLKGDAFVSNDNS